MFFAVLAISTLYLESVIFHMSERNLPHYCIIFWIAKRFTVKRCLECLLFSCLWDMSDFSPTWLEVVVCLFTVVIFVIPSFFLFYIFTSEHVSDTIASGNVLIEPTNMILSLFDISPEAAYFVTLHLSFFYPIFIYKSSKSIKFSCQWCGWARFYRLHAILLREWDWCNILFLHNLTIECFNFAIFTCFQTLWLHW